MNRILLVVLALFLSLGAAAQQEAPSVEINPDACERFQAMVTNVPAGDEVRFQLGHDLVKKTTVSEQDTAASFDSGPFPTGDWGFSVAVGGHVVMDQIVTVPPCPTGELPFTGDATETLLIVAGCLFVLGAMFLLIVKHTGRTHGDGPGSDE